jgi:hypothetical protein
MRFVSQTPSHSKRAYVVNLASASNTSNPTGEPDGDCHDLGVMVGEERVRGVSPATEERLLLPPPRRDPQPFAGNNSSRIPCDKAVVGGQGAALHAAKERTERDALAIRQ